MKLTKDNQTLFTVLCSLFVNKVGAHINRRAFGDYTTLVAERNAEGEIHLINLMFRPPKAEQEVCLLALPAYENQVSFNVANWFTKRTIHRLNKVLGYVNLVIVKQGEDWHIMDQNGSHALFNRSGVVDLSRAHGEEIY